MRSYALLGCLAAALSASLVSASGCGGNSGTGGTGGTGGSSKSSSTASTGSSTGGGANGCADATIDTTGCSTVVKPSGSDDTKGVQTALIDAKSSSTLCLCPGNYTFTQQLSLTVPSVTVKGLGANIDDTSLDFSGVTGGGNDTMLVTADNFTIENLEVKNTPGNGVVVRQAAGPTFRKLHVTWDSPDPTKHGAYAVYPAQCTNVLVEDCEVEGAADAAIYVGQGDGAILRNNKAHDSVLGIELENTTNGEAYGNESYNNSGGMAIFLLGDLTKKTADHCLLHDNNIHDNNHVNFGDPKTVVAHVPVGTGVIVVGGTNHEVRTNTITNNESGGVLVVSYSLMVALIPGAMADPMIDPDPQNIYIHDNTFMGNGTSPQVPVTLIGVTPVENVLWDGICKSGMPATNDAKFCIGTKAPFPSFRMFDGKDLATTPVQSTDPTPYECDLPQIPASP